ncbi:uncharacterized protein LOC132936523 [Metopolophium dirhodum]|uniref:uncharacterized protein LOC132936523 n=1 Tax=Metopolophium dirhodum TaxID=44670 RepID=UPI00299062FB|nr:uncharacterized protein LOC132936523 [Metopolophium dirhodum]
MEQNTEPSMSTLWTRCRIIGFINMVSGKLNIIVLVMKSIKTKAEKDEQLFADIVRNHFGLVLIIFYIICIMILIFLIAFFRVNYGITSATEPGNGDKTGRWLIYHKVLFCINIILTIIMAINEPTSLISDVIILIILAIQIYIVNAYHTRITSTGGII